MSIITPASIFAVSGGAKGITARCVERLAAHYGCKFILLGRSTLESDPTWAANAADEAALKQAAMAELKAQGEKPTPMAVGKMSRAVLSSREIQGTLDTIQANGGQAVYVSADITDAVGVKNALVEAAAQLGADVNTIDGVIHGAGNLADKLIENKTEKDFEMVYAAKVHGLENLLSALPALDHLVLFSSVAGFYGNVGQADYAIANEVLNKAAHIYKKQHPHCHVVSINWGPWDAGMVTTELKRYFEENNIKVIPVEVGAHMLIEELEQLPGDNAVQVVVGSGISHIAAEQDATLRTHRLQRIMRLQDNPFLQDHVVDGKAVLPMASAMSWICNTAEGLYPGYRVFNFDNYSVLKGIIFDDTLADKYILEITEREKTADAIHVDVMASSQTAGARMPRYHYKTSLTLTSKIPPMPPYPGMDLTPSLDIPGAQFYDDYTLFHGFAFKGVDRVLNIRKGHITLRCHLPVVPARYQGQFPVHSFNYFMTDIGFQSMGIYAKHFYQAGSLPLKAGHGDHYADVPWGEVFYVSLEVHQESDTGLVTTLYIHDVDSKLYMKVTGGEITISTRLNDLFRRNRLPQPLA